MHRGGRQHNADMAKPRRDRGCQPGAKTQQDDGARVLLKQRGFGVGWVGEEFGRGRVGDHDCERLCWTLLALPQRVNGCRVRCVA